MILSSAAATGAGVLVGLVLGVIGGGGSILAVPLLLYGVGISDPHRAIGTASLAVAASAALSLVPHVRAGTVKWPCASVFAASGVFGAAIGAWAGRQVDGQKLIALFALAMLAVAANMLRRRADGGDPNVRITPRIAWRLAGLGLLAGLAAGFFGIGGGFLILPGLLLGSGMAVLNAVGSSLLGVAAFGLTTAVSYASAGLVDWGIAGLFILGGAIGGWFGQGLAQRLAQRRGLLTRLFAAMLVLVAAYMLYRSAMLHFGNVMF